MQNLAAILANTTGSDWTALAAIITIIIGSATVVGVLIARLVVKPLIDAAKKELSDKIDDIVDSMVSKEVFNAYMAADKTEHGEMKSQLVRIFNRMDHIGS